jgi:hypothetical protein
MVDYHIFKIRYWSEVMAELCYRYRPEYGTYKISATHPRVYISDWFHFSDTTIPERRDPMFFEASNPVEPIARMAGELYVGAEPVLEHFDMEEPKRQFFTDFMDAMAHGEYIVETGRKRDYLHPAGDWLLDEYESLGVEDKYV